jgi:hypothetical protein
MSRYRCCAEFWKNRADETRAIRDMTIGEEPRRILAEMAADYDRLYDLALTGSDLSQRQQAIDVLLSSSLSAARDSEPNI